MVTALCFASVTGFTGACIRFPDDTPSKATALVDGEATMLVDGEALARDVSVADEGGPEDASLLTNDGSLEVGSPLPPPVCARFDPSITQDIAEDMVSTLLVDCRIRRHFLAIPAVRLSHFQECFAAQLASVLGCVYPDGKRYKYPAFDSQGQFCRDMQTGHAAMSTSDGDFDAFVDDLDGVLRTHQFTESEVSRTLKVFGSVRSDVVKKKDAGPTALCDERDASGEAAGDGAARISDGGPPLTPSGDAGADARFEALPP